MVAPIRVIAIMITQSIPMIRPALAMLSLIAFAAPATGQTVEECDWRASAQALVEPWDAPYNSRTFANGDVRLAVTDVIEPAAGAFHLIILSPPYDELGGRQCRIVSADGTIGFSGLTLEAMIADYDPAVGLRFAMQSGAYDPKTGTTLPMTLRVTLNQATGAITAELEHLP